MQPDEIQTLIDYNYWANGQILNAASQLSTHALNASNSLVWGSIRGTLVHALAAEWIWLQRCIGQSPNALLDEMDFPDLAALRVRWDREEAAMRAFVTECTEAQLSSPLHYQTTSGKEMSQPLWQILAHVVNHGTQHRAEVAHVLTELGASPGDVDLIIFLRDRT
ncbi:MAG: DinB family protein [Caldilineaceae bacterium]|nr:DinB family protein [Caldilineaceae bacterium]